MAQYSYKIIDKAGKTKKGTIEAENIDKARNSLKAEGSILSLEEASALNRDINISFGKKKKVKVRDMGVFCKQFKSILQAGIGMVDALDMLAQQTNSQVLKESLKNVKDNVQKGDTLNMAMRKEGTVFPSLLLNMVEAGEASGSLEVALDRMSTHFDKDARLKGIVKKAMMYPIVLIIVTIVIAAIMLIKVLPSFASTFASMGSDLPGYTKFIMGLSDSLIDTWYIWIIAIVGIMFAYKAYAKTEKGSSRPGMRHPECPDPDPPEPGPETWHRVPPPQCRKSGTKFEDLRYSDLSESVLSVRRWPPYTSESDCPALR